MVTWDPCRFQKHLLAVFVFLLIFSNGLNASESCKRGCPVSDRGGLRYKAGSMYAYNFDSVITIALSTANSDETSLKVQGQANIFAEGNCGLTIKLSDVNVVQNKDGSGKGLTRKFTAGVDKPVQFTMANGQLESQICTDPSDTDYSINLKRAIISMLQRTVGTEKTHETDVFGVCPTILSSTTNSDGSEIVTKIRNLNACKYRETLSNGFVSGLVNERAGIKSTPLLTSDYSQEQEIVNGIIERVQLIEEYKFVPLSNAQNGGAVRAKVRSTLKRTKTSSMAAPALNGGVSQSIIFKSPRSIAIDNADIVRKVLTATVNDLQDHTGPKSAQQLTELIRLMRATSQQHLTTLYRDVRAGTVHPDKSLARKVFLDALFRVGTDDSVSTVAKFIESELDDREKRLAYMSFNLVDHVDDKSLEAINGLLGKNPPNEAFLSIGHLISKYCSQHSCEQNRIVQSIAGRFAAKLNNCQAQTQKQEDSIVNVLKGIRNARPLASFAVDRLLQCTGEKQSARLRVAALQALAATACDAKAQSTSSTILKNRNEDSEIRIEAYLTYVACPSSTVANQIGEIINSEPVYQVGSFISTHLRSIRDSTDAYRESARHHFGNIHVTKKFPIDPRRYSFNQELSYAFESLGLGASADYSLIYSQRGFLPRSVRLNLTAEVFGHDFNFFELQGRQENLEIVLEHYLGPKGFFTERSHEARQRSKRSTRDELNAMAKKLRPYGNAVENDILFDYSVKMFGNELVFLSLGDEIARDSDTLANKIGTAFEDFQNKAKNFEHDCRSHSIFLDSELVYPTGMGFPLELIAQGTGVGRFKMAASLDLKDLPGKWENSEYRVKLVPSVNIDVTGMMKVDAQVLSTGLKVHASVYTSTGSDVTLKIMQGKEFKIDINVPFKKQKIFSFDHEVEFVVSDPTKETVHVPLRGKKTDITTDHCFDQLSLFGLTVCGIISRPSPDAASAVVGFPLSGPTRVSLTLETEQTIQLSGSHLHEAGKETWLLRYDTPGSQISHATELQFELGTAPKWYGRASFKNPNKTISVEAGLSNNDQELAVYGEYEQDADKSLAKIGLTKSGPNEYRPLVLIQTRNKPIDNIAGYRADGKIFAEDKGSSKRYKFENIRILDPRNAATTLNGWVELGAGSVSETGGPGLSMDMRVTNSENKNYDIKSKFMIQLKHYVASMTVLNDANPCSSGSFSWELKHPDGNVKSDLIIAHGSQLRNSYELHNDFSFEPDKSKARFLKFQNSFVSKEPSAKLKVNGQVAPNLLEYDVEGSFRKSKVASSLTMHRNQKSTGDYDADLSITLNHYKADLKAKRTIQDGASILDHTLSTSWGTSGSLKGKVSHRFTPTDAHVDLQGSVQFTEKDESFGATVLFNASPKNSQGNIKLTRGATDLIMFNGNYVRGENANGKFDVTIKDVLTGKGELKSKSGTGDGSFLVNLKKLNRKIKFETKYTIAAPTYNLDTTVFYDFEKDNAKKVTFNTKNQIDRHNVDSNNALEIGSDKYSATVKGHHDGVFLDGNVNGRFSLSLPNRRQLGGEIDRKMTRKDDTADGYAKVKLTDTLPDGKQRSLEMDGKFSGINPKARLFDIYHMFKYINFDGKDGIVESHLKHLPNGHFKMAESTFALKGSLIDDPLALSVMIDEYCKEHAVYRMNGKYGDALNGNWNGNYHVGGRAKPAKYELQMNLDAPKTDFKTYKWETHGSFLRPEVESDGIYEAKIHSSEEFGQWSTKLDGTAKGNAQHGSWSLSYDYPKVGPGKLDGSYVREEHDGAGKYQLNTVYEQKDKIIKMNVDASRTDDKALTFRYTLTTPYEQVRNFEVVFKGEKSDDRSYVANLQMIRNEIAYGLNTAVVLSDIQTSADVTIQYPGRTTKFYGSLERLGPNKGRSKLKLENIGEYGFDGAAEWAYVSNDNFHLKVDMDAPKLKLDKVHIEANSQSKSGSAKGVEFKAIAGGKNILSGSAEFTLKHEKSKTVIEGQGTVQLYDKPRQAKFELVRQTFELGHDTEIGVSYKFNGLFGPKNIVSEAKMTNKNFILKLASCEEKKQCTNFEIQSVMIVKKDQIDLQEHKLMVLIDLRELGYPHEFELQSKLSRNGMKFEHELEMKIMAKGDNTYQLQTYIQPTKSGATMKLLRREIVLENVYTIPEEIFGHYETSTTLYLDKKGQPNEKTTISFVGDLNRVEKTAINAHGSVKFAHPTVKPLSISGAIDLNADRKLATSRIEFDLFRSPKQKIIASVKYQNTDQTGRGVNITTEAVLKSDGFNFEYGFDGHTAISFERHELSAGGSLKSPRNDLRFTGFVAANSNSFEIVTVAFDEPIFNAHGTLSPKKSELRAEFNILGTKPVEFSAQSTGLTSASFQLQRKNLYSVEGKVNTGKEATLVMTGGGKELFSGKLSLDPAHLISTQYKVNDDDIKEFMSKVEDQTRKDMERSRSEIDNRFKKVRENYEHQLSALKGSIPDFSALQSSYENSMNKLIDELSADPSLRDVIEFYKSIFQTITRVVKTLSQTFAENYQKLSESSVEIYEKLSGVVKEKIMPLFQKTMKNIASILSEWYAETIKLLTSAFQTVAKTMKTFEADFNRVGKAAGEFYKSFSAAFTKLWNVLQKEFEDIGKMVREFFEALPTWENVKAAMMKYVGGFEGFKQVATVLNEMLNQAKEFLPTAELKDFLQKLHDYIEMKISETPVDDVHKIQDLYATLFNAIRALIMQFRAGEKPSSIFYPVPFTLDAIRQIPLWTTFKFSPINYLRNENWSTLKGLYTQANPRHVSIPFDLRGHVADGEHIFTFDGRHMTFPGSCAYVLVQDLGNKFSVVANLQDGKMKSIVLTDKSNSIEIGANGLLKLNGKPSDYPVHNKDMHAWRRYYSVFALTEFGADLKCSLDLRVCHVNVNGYYTGKTRGLLGNGNNEPYDDFILPNGKITENYAEFGNAYGLTTSCQQVRGHNHQHGSADPICKELFDSDSSLMLGYIFTDPANYLEACNHAVEKAADKQDAACNIALTYASAARDDHIPVEMPSQCLKCGRNERSIGDEFEAKTPQKKADIVFVVDTNVDELINELVQNVMTELRAQLKFRDMTDVHIAVIGYSEDMRYPQIYSTNGKLDFTGKLDKIDLSTAPNYNDRVKTGHRNLFNTYLDRLDKIVADAIAPSDARAFNLAMDYPFRPDANRVIVAVRSDQLAYTTPLKITGALVSNEVAKSRGITLHLIGPVKDFQLAGKPQQQANVVGFNSRVAVMVGESKKRSNLGSPDLRTNIKYSSDMGVDFVQREGGYIFPTQNFEANKDKAKERKQFPTAVANALADQIARTELINECECSLHNGLVAADKCKTTQQNLLPPPQKKQPARGSSS